MQIFMNHTTGDLCALQCVSIASSWLGDKSRKLVQTAEHSFAQMALAFQNAPCHWWFAPRTIRLCLRSKILRIGSKKGEQSLCFERCGFTTDE